MHRYFFVILTMVAAVAGAVAIVSFRYHTVGGPVIVGSGTLIVMLFLLPRLAGQFDRSFTRRIMYFAFVTKILSSTIFIIFFLLVEQGLKDGNRYAKRGTIIADTLRDGDLSILISQFAVGTKFMELLTGVIFSVTGSTIYGGFVLFGMLGLIGSILYYHAFVVAVPGGKTRLFAVLVMFFPAILFWTTPIGKDAMVFFVGGLTAYGLALAIVRGRPVGFLLVAVGILVAFLTRPEIATVFAIAVLFAIVLWAVRGVGSGTGWRVLVLAATSVVVILGMSALPSALGVDRLSIDTIVEVLVDQANNDFDPGGDASNYEVTPITSPIWLPMSFVTTLIRPFPGELISPQGILQSAEGVVLAALLIINFKSGFRSIAAARREPFMLFTLVFAIAMILILSSTANFGLLARLRIILLPEIFMMVAYRPSPKTSPEPTGQESEGRTEISGRLATAS